MKNFKLNNIIYIVEHSVYGNPNGKLNEPYVIEAQITEIETQNNKTIYHSSGTNTRGVYDSTDKNTFNTLSEATQYIKDNRDEIIKESFQEHNEFINNLKKKKRLI